MTTNKVRWQRESDGTCVPYMFEEKNGRWAWYRYSASKACVPDHAYAISKGYASYVQARKMGYEVAEAVK